MAAPRPLGNEVLFRALGDAKKLLGIDRLSSGGFVNRSRTFTNPYVEISFDKEIQQLRLGAGDEFHGEGILAVTKALLQSGVGYIGGYQGAPVSHLLDVMVQARDLVAELGVHVEACSNEASAAAMLGASIHYPVGVS